MERQAGLSKPPYLVPSMAEVAAIPPNGLRVASTFSGAGGSCLGYRMAGYRVVWASEFIPAARETYRANHPGSILDPRDIREVTAVEVLAATGLGVGELDLLDGSPPCASFSTAGSRAKGWGKVRAYSGTRQRTDDLFGEYLRLVDGIRPKVFVAENVSGLVKGVARGYFIEIMRAMKGLGYRVEARLLDAQWLGVPQARQRLFFQGVREDLGAGPAFPLPLPYRYGTAEAIADLAGAGVEPGADISGYAIGEEWGRIRPGDKSVRYFNLKKPGLDDPSFTITATGGGAGTASVVHPTERRKFTIAELRRICGFPDDFILIGTYAQRWERLGRSVPPVMMAAVAATIRDRVFLRDRPRAER